MQRHNVIYCIDPGKGCLLRTVCVMKNRAHYDFYVGSEGGMEVAYSMDIDFTQNIMKEDID